MGEQRRQSSACLCPRPATAPPARRHIRAAAPRVPASRPGVAGPARPGRPGPAPQPHPSPRPPALPWLQPGLGRLSVDSAGGSRGRSCAPTSPHRRPPPSAPSVDRRGRGPAAGAGRAGPAGLHLCGGEGSEGARWAGAAGLGANLAARDPRRRRVRGGAQNCAALSPGASLLSSQRAASWGSASPSGLEPDPQRERKGPPGTPRRRLWKERGFAPRVGEKPLILLPSSSQPSRFSGCESDLGPSY